MKGLRETGEAFVGLSESISELQKQLWGTQYDEAMEKRGEFLRIFEVKESKGIYKYIMRYYILTGFTAPSLAQIRLDLTENENRTEGDGGGVSWLGLGITLEDAQYVLE